MHLSYMLIMDIRGYSFDVRVYCFHKLRIEFIVFKIGVTCMKGLPW